MRIVIAGAGAIGGYIGARLAQGRRRRRAVRARPASARDAGARPARDQPRRRLRGAAAGHRRSRRRSATADVVFLGVKAHGLTALAPQLRPLFGPDTVVVSTQNGIPWWYFQDYGGELDGLRLERVDPGGVDRGGDRAAPRRRIAGLFRDRHRRARRHPPHRRQSHQLRRAGRHASRSARRRSPRR